MSNYNKRLDKIFPDESKDTELQHHLRNVWHDNFSEQEFIDEMEAYITSLIKELVDEVIGEDESSGIFPGIGESSTMRDDLRADQRTHLQSIFKREFEEV